MLQLSLEHSNVDQSTNQDKLQPYSEHIRQVRASGSYDQPECSINLPNDQALFDSVDRVVKEKVTDALKYNIVVGIGGSNLGTKAVYDALFGYRDVMEPTGSQNYYLPKRQVLSGLLPYSTYSVRLNALRKSS